jgi:predicted nucleotidyltransferase
MRNKLIAYALDFASFLLESGVEPRRIILFGSVVSGDFDRESDVDIFVDIGEAEEKNVRNALKVFESTFGERWMMKGMNNVISLKVGDLDRWKGLKRSIQSSGIMLYGRYAEFPENMKSYLLFRLDFSGIPRAGKVRLWRELYGYAQKVGRKRYEKTGIVKSLGGQKIEKGAVLLPSEKSGELTGFLNKNRIKFRVNEIWSDNL